MTIRITGPLPVGVPEPGVLPDVAISAEARAAAELAIFAVGWVFLHEIRHLKHQQEGTAVPPDGEPAKQQAQEASCDEFATRFILSDVVPRTDPRRLKRQLSKITR